MAVMTRSNSLSLINTQEVSKIGSDKLNTGKQRLHMILNHDLASDSGSLERVNMPSFNHLNHHYRQIESSLSKEPREEVPRPKTINTYNLDRDYKN